MSDCNCTEIFEVPVGDTWDKEFDITDENGDVVSLADTTITLDIFQLNGTPVKSQPATIDEDTNTFTFTLDTVFWGKVKKGTYECRLIKKVGAETETMEISTFKAL